MSNLAKIQNSSGIIVSFVCILCFLGSTTVQSRMCKFQNEFKFNELYPDTALKQKPDSLLVIKHTRELFAYKRGTLLKIYHISLGPNAVGPKHFQNDKKTPEGIYHISGKNPQSEYHKNLAVSYPSDNDRKYATQHHLQTGGDIKIHGLPNGETDVDWYENNDWTDGCIGTNNKNIDELYEMVPVGTVINIVE